MTQTNIADVIERGEVEQAKQELGSQSPDAVNSPTDELSPVDELVSPGRGGTMSSDDLARRDSQGEARKSFGAFISSSAEDVDVQDRGMIHSLVRRVLEHQVTQVVSAILVFTTIILICMDTNARAKKSDPSEWEDALMLVCFIAYALELVATVFVQGRSSISDPWNYIDLAVIMTSLIDYIAALVYSGNGLGFLKLLRICRLLRVGRLLRKVKLLQCVSWLKEAYLLSVMMASCLRTLIWAALICFCVITVWSILAVELLNDVVQELALSGVWDGCERCSRSFGSIWEANWTFFQTIVAGDSWGVMALPVIEKQPWSAIIFVGVLLSIVFGILNLISAVVIDMFAERRSKDIHAMANEMEYEETMEKKELQTMFKQIDEDDSGEVSLEELRAGAVKVRNFRNYLRVLDIDDHDLAELFAMIDADGSGEVDPEEFIEALYRMKHTDPKTSTRIMKHMVTNMFSRQQELEGKLIGIQQGVLDRLQTVEARLVNDLGRAASQTDVNEILKDHALRVDDTIAKAVEKAAQAAMHESMKKALSKTNRAAKRLATTGSDHAARVGEVVKKVYAGSPTSAGDFARQLSNGSGSDCFFRQFSSSACSEVGHQVSTPRFADIKKQTSCADPDGGALVVAKKDPYITPPEIYSAAPEIDIKALASKVAEKVIDVNGLPAARQKLAGLPVADDEVLHALLRGPKFPRGAPSARSCDDLRTRKDASPEPTLDDVASPRKQGGKKPPKGAVAAILKGSRSPMRSPRVDSSPEGSPAPRAVPLREASTSPKETQRRLGDDSHQLGEENQPDSLPPAPLASNGSALAPPSPFSESLPERTGNQDDLELVAPKTGRQAI